MGEEYTIVRSRGRGMLGIDKPGRGGGGAADVGVGAAWGQEGQRGERKCSWGAIFGKISKKKKFCGLPDLASLSSNSQL